MKARSSSSLVTSPIPAGALLLVLLAACGASDGTITSRPKPATSAAPAIPAAQDDSSPAAADAPAAAASTDSPPAAAPPTVVDDPDVAALIQAERLDGVFVLLDPAQNLLHVSDRVRADTGYLPASTFKIPNTLIGLQTGVIPDERFALPWDRKTRQIAAWNRDHDLASAMRFSVVWFYQEVARRIGAARMQQWVDALDYGNRNIGPAIDRFWLDGAMRISPRQQVSFLHRLARGALPIEPAHVALLLRIIELERQGSVVLRGKTGLAMGDEQTIGWLVGLVEKDGISYPYALLVLGSSDDAKRMIPLRHDLARRILARHGLWQS